MKRKLWVFSCSAVTADKALKWFSIGEGGFLLSLNSLLKVLQEVHVQYNSLVFWRWKVRAYERTIRQIQRKKCAERKVIDVF